jgi:hypothetical protein
LTPLWRNKIETGENNGKQADDKKNTQAAKRVTEVVKKNTQAVRKNS